MIDISTNYLGLELRSPLVVGAAAPLTKEISNIKSINQLQGSMSQINRPDFSIFERVEYLKAVQTYLPHFGLLHRQ
ncbi:MAG: hypothetical protein RLZZ171_2440 [Cyanobacteriota bacterium]|jgi:hypothetical protein